MKNSINRTTTSNTLFDRIAATKGRFFGLYLKNGEAVNAQYRSQSQSYLNVYDRNLKTTRRFHKASVIKATV